MAHSKERLIELIEAYVAAKVTGNAALSAMAAGALQQILVAVTFVEPLTDPTPEDFATPESDVPTPVRRTRKGGAE